MSSCPKWAATWRHEFIRNSGICLSAMKFSILAKNYPFVLIKNFTLIFLSPIKESSSCNALTSFKSNGNPTKNFDSGCYIKHKGNWSNNIHSINLKDPSPFREMDQWRTFSKLKSSVTWHCWRYHTLLKKEVFLDSSIGISKY